MYRNTFLERHKGHSTSHSELLNPPSLGFSGKSATCIVRFLTFLNEVYLISFSLFFLSAAIDPSVSVQAQVSVELGGELQGPSPWGGSLGHAFLSLTSPRTIEPAGTYRQSVFWGEVASGTKMTFGVHSPC